MSDQGSLFGITVPPDVKLTQRQWFALETIASSTPSSERLGTELHRRRGCDYCSNGLDCFYAEADGASVGAALRSKGLVRFSRKRDCWYLVETGLPAPEPPPGQQIPY